MSKTLSERFGLGRQEAREIPRVVAAQEVQHERTVVERGALVSAMRGQDQERRAALPPFATVFASFNAGTLIKMMLFGIGGAVLGLVFGPLIMGSLLQTFVYGFGVDFVGAPIYYLISTILSTIIGAAIGAFLPYHYNKMHR